MFSCPVPSPGKFSVQHKTLLIYFVINHDILTEQQVNHGIVSLIPDRSVQHWDHRCKATSFLAIQN